MQIIKLRRIANNEGADNDDDYDYDGQSMVGDLIVVVGGHRGTQGDSESFCKDSELGQLLMTCGKLSNQASAVNNRLSGSDCSSAK